MSPGRFTTCRKRAEFGAEGLWQGLWFRVECKVNYFTEMCRGSEAGSYRRNMNVEWLYWYNTTGSGCTGRTPRPLAVRPPAGIVQSFGLRVDGRVYGVGQSAR